MYKDITRVKMIVDKKIKVIDRIITICAFLSLSMIAIGAPESRPNVLLIICDDLNTHVSTSQYPLIHTPSFDELAAAGMTFDRAYCQYPVCNPSRTSFLTGLYPESTGVIDNYTDIRQSRPGSVSMPQRFKEAGYWTGSTGKVFHNSTEQGHTAWHEFIHFSNDEMPMVTPIRQAFESQHGSIDQGNAKKLWKEFYPTIAPQTRGQKPGYGPSGLRDEQHKDGKNVQQIISWLKNKRYGDKPFFMACGIHKPHGPFLAPDAYFDLYPKKELKFSPPPADFWDQAPAEAMTKRYERFGFEFGVENDSLRREYTQAYHACISFVDAQIGLMFEALKSTGHWDDTIIVLMSDHGYQLGDHFMWGKVMLFETCDRVPFIIRAPGISIPGSISTGLVELVDLYPTLAELCGVSPPNDLQGRSLLPMLLDSKTPGKKVVYTVVRRGNLRLGKNAPEQYEKPLNILGKAIRTDRWRYTLWPKGGEELYDLQNDPSEHKNLVRSPEYADIVENMRTRLAQAEREAAGEVHRLE
jgi:iduronate 2-sulfatase